MSDQQEAESERYSISPGHTRFEIPGNLRRGKREETLELGHHAVKVRVRGGIEAKALRLTRAYLTASGESFPILGIWKWDPEEGRSDVAHLRFDPMRLNDRLQIRGFERARGERRSSGCRSDSRVDKSEEHLLAQLRNVLQGVDQTDREREVRRTAWALRRTDAERALQAVFARAQVAFVVAAGEGEGNGTALYLDLGVRL